jgi:hypothetical protein
VGSVRRAPAALPRRQLIGVVQIVLDDRDLGPGDQRQVMLANLLAETPTGGEVKASTNARVVSVACRWW